MQSKSKTLKKFAATLTIVSFILTIPGLASYQALALDVRESAPIKTAGAEKISFTPTLGGLPQSFEGGALSGTNLPGIETHQDLSLQAGAGTDNLLVVPERISPDTHIAMD